MQNRIREIRNYYGLSQEAFGRRLGVSRSSIVNAELGRSEQTDLFYEHLCDIYHVNIKWLKTGEGERFARNRGLEDALDKMILSDDQKALILEVVKLPPDMQKAFLAIMRNSGKNS